MLHTKKTRAISLRKKGHTYTEIQRLLDVPKSTLSYWFRSLQISDDIKKNNVKMAKVVWAENITRFNRHRAEQTRQKRTDSRNTFAGEISKLSKREIKLIGIALYWAEGYKKSNWSLVFCNSDPSMVKLMMMFFRKICHVPEEKLKAQVQIHANISPKKANEFWSALTGIPSRSFCKPLLQQSKSSKGRRGNTLPYGTFRIRIDDVALVDKILGWIQGLENQSE